MTGETSLSYNNKEGLKGKLHPHKFTLWVAMASITMMFAGLTSAYIVKSNLTGWQNIKMPGIFYFSTLVIVLCSLTLIFAQSMFKQRFFARYRALVAVSMVLGAVFLAMQYIGFSDLWNRQHITLKGSTGAGQFLYVIFGLHALHVLGGIIALAVIFFKTFFGRTKVYSSVPIEIAAIYWHFVDVLWIYLLVFFIAIR